MERPIKAESVCLLQVGSQRRERKMAQDQSLASNSTIELESGRSLQIEEQNKEKNGTAFDL